MLIEAGSPIFSSYFWNIHEITLNNGNRTNNFYEGWNNYFNKLVGTNNPSLWLVVKCIQQNEARQCGLENHFFSQI